MIAMSSFHASVLANQFKGYRGDIVEVTRMAWYHRIIISRDSEGREKYTKLKRSACTSY